jgi:uncharacterized protein
MEKVEEAKKYFVELVEKEKDIYGMLEHVKIVERWANHILEKHSEADREVVLLGVWLHDTGIYPLNKDDHAVVGEKKAVNFLKKIKLEEDKIRKVAHCIRAHRCRDIMPATIEAKILACADSASHLLDFAYLDIIMKNKIKNSNYSALDKLERDFRDLGNFPEIKKELSKLYETWKDLLVEFKKINDKI